jgi:hypothetical protein
MNADDAAAAFADLDDSIDRHWCPGRYRVAAFADLAAEELQRHGMPSQGRPPRAPVRQGGGGQESSRINARWNTKGVMRCVRLCAGGGGALFLLSAI